MFGYRCLNTTAAAPGGSAECAVAYDNYVFVFNIHTGEALRAFRGDRENLHPPPYFGHTRAITCMYVVECGAA